jgi:acetylornithine deacetylase
MENPQSDEGWSDVLDKIDADAMLGLARGALRIPSLSGNEHEAARYFADHMAERGLDVELQEVPETPNMSASLNAIGRIKGSGEGPSLLYNGHLDHNPVCDGWSKDPFGAEVHDGWLFGFVHMKATNACFIEALSAVMRSGRKLKGDITVANVCGELRGGIGTQHTLKNGVTADYFISGEPTNMEICTRHTIPVILRMHARGSMKHYSTAPAPGIKGINAIEKMTSIIAALGPSHTPLPSRKDGGWLSFEPRPGFEGLPQLSVGAIRGGISSEYRDDRPALLPDLCTVTLDIRLMPGMSRDTIAKDLADLQARLQKEDPDIRFDFDFRDTGWTHFFNDPDDSAVVQSVACSHRHIYDAQPQWSKLLTYACTDASWMSKQGMKGIIYGPCGPYLSRADERCEVEELIAATRVYAGAIARLCT